MVRLAAVLTLQRLVDGVDNPRVCFLLTDNDAFDDFQFLACLGNLVE